ncbi:MAG: carbohydrate-binding domain-containing protein [Porcipelethomonas sp.]
MYGKSRIRRIVSGVTALTVIAGGAGFGLSGKMIPEVKVSAAASICDLNADGSVNSDDVTLLRNFLTNKKDEIPAGANADFNGDNAVNAFDLVMLKRIAVESFISEINYIHLNGSSISVEGQGVDLSADNTVATITAGGTYYVDGTLTDGQIYVNASDSDKVNIVLNGVNVTCSTNAPIYCVNADKTVITLAAGTENVLNDTETYTDAEADSTIYSKDDLTINGSGSLTVNSNYLYSITSNDDLKINGGNITVKHNSVDPDGAAVKGKKSVEIKDGNLKVTCAADDTETGADAIISNDSTDTTVGYILISGGTVDINAKGGDAIKSKSNYVEITGGKVTAKAENDAIQAGTSVKISSGEVYAYGKRSLTAGAGYTADITGGSVVATSNEAFTNTAGITVNTMILNYTEKLDKAQIDIKKNGTDVYSITPDKKYTYVLICNDKFTDGTYQVYTGGAQMTHDAAASDGEFAVSSGAVNTFNNVAAISGSVVTPAEGNSIVLSNSGITFSGTGASISADMKTISILEPGTYSVTGDMSDGQIVVDVDKTTYADGLVELSLEGMSLTNSSTSPVYVAQIGDKCSISAKSGTVNTISDGSAAYTNADEDSGAIYSKDDLTIKGSGTLNVYGNYADAVVCKNDLRINNGTVNVTAVDDGIRGKDSVRIGNPDDMVENGGTGDFSSLSVTVKTTSGDGITSTNATETDSGIITINGGSVNIDSYADGIQAEQEFVMNGGSVEIHTYEGYGFTGTASSGGQTGGPGGGFGMDGNSNKVDISAKGIKAVGLYDSTGTTYQSGGNLTINGGTVNIDSSDDSLHCAGNMNLYGGRLTLASADDGVHSDSNLTIGNGSASTLDDVVIYVSYCYEGMEGMNIEQNSGTVIVNSVDDGYNAAGGADGSGSTSPGGWNPGGGMGSSSGNYQMNIKGGFALVNATDGDHDGFDSNGSLTISGGYAISNGNETFDTDGALSYTGGVFVAEGSCNLTSTVSASCSASSGTRITLADSSGNVIVSFIADKSVSQIKAGCNGYSSVKVYTGGTISGGTNLSVLDSTQECYVNGTISGGTEASSGSTGGWG